MLIGIVCFLACLCVLMLLFFCVCLVAFFPALFVLMLFVRSWGVWVVSPHVVWVNVVCLFVFYWFMVCLSFWCFDLFWIVFIWAPFLYVLMLLVCLCVLFIVFPRLMFWCFPHVFHLSWCCSLFICLLNCSPPRFVCVDVVCACFSCF